MTSTATPTPRPLLAEQGFRVIVPYLRGFGSTRFRSANTVRNGQQAALAHDVIALMDALDIRDAVLGGYDWGGAHRQQRRRAVAAAVRRSRRRQRLYHRQPGRQSGNRCRRRPNCGWWYQYYFATPRGELGYRQNTKEFNRLIWTKASPLWKFDDATYDLSAASFDNPDHVDIVVHNYRWRLSLAPGEPRFDARRGPAGRQAARHRSDDHDRVRLRRCGQGRSRLPRALHRAV